MKKLTGIAVIILAALICSFGVGNAAYTRRQTGLTWNSSILMEHQFSLTPVVFLTLSVHHLYPHQSHTKPKYIFLQAIQDLRFAALNWESIGYQ